MDKNVLNIMMWACVGVLGVACSYYSSSYIASGVIHVSNNYFHLNLNPEVVEGFVMGSLCLTVVSIVMPQMVDCAMSIALSNIDSTIYAASFYEPASVVIAKELLVLTDVIQPVTTALANVDINDKLSIMIENKIMDASIYIREVYYNHNSSIYNCYDSGLYFNKISENILIIDSKLIRMYYLSDMMLYNDINNILFNLYTNKVIPLDNSAYVFTKEMCANIQLLDTMFRLGSGADGVSALELVLRTEFFNTYMMNVHGEEIMHFMDGGAIDPRNIIRKDYIITMLDIMTVSNLDYLMISDIIFNSQEIIEIVDSVD